jgi:cell filamentation protein
MTTRYAHKDAYTYKDSSVLKNKADHKTQEALDKFERLSVANRMVEDPPEGKFDNQHLKAIHKHLFQDVYDWAGEERTVSISKGKTLFCNPRFIANMVADILDKLAKENHLRGLPPEEFVERAAHYVLELNVAHPFREGNGRTTRYFLSLIAQNAGFEIDIERLKEGWVNACIEGVTNSEEPMSDVIAKALIVFED